MSAYRYIINMNFGQLLLSKKFSVNRLSKASGVSRTTILDLVKGRSDLRKASGINLYKIAKALGVSMETLIEIDSPYDKDKITGKPNDKSYYEYSLNTNLSKILRNLKNSIVSDNKLKQGYWKDLLIEEITSLRRKDEISSDAYEYFVFTYLQ